MLTVHGRCKEHNKHRVGSANYAIIKRIKETLKIPVIANGGISTFQDVQQCMELTGVDGVMSSEAILEYPALFDGEKLHDLDTLMLEYFDMYEKYPGEADLKTIRSHMFKFLHVGLQKHTDIRDILNQSKGYEPLRDVAVKLQERRKEESPEDKIGWYYRHWKGMNIDKEAIKTYSLEQWDDQCVKDPLLEKLLASEPYKRIKREASNNEPRKEA